MPFSNLRCDITTRYQSLLVQVSGEDSTGRILINGLIVKWLLGCEARSFRSITTWNAGNV